MSRSTKTNLTKVAGAEATRPELGGIAGGGVGAGAAKILSNEAVTLVGPPAWSCRVCKAPLVAEGVESEAALCPVCRELNFPLAVSGHSSTSGSFATGGGRRGAARASATLPAAWVALVLGLVASVLFPAGLVAIVVGWLALKKIDREGGRPAGRGFAQAGIALGALFGIGSPIVIAALALPAIKAVQLTVDTSDPEGVRAVAKRFGGNPPPDWMRPGHAYESPYQGVRNFDLVDNPDRPRVLFSAIEMQKLLGRPMIENGIASRLYDVNWPAESVWTREETWGDAGSRTKEPAGQTIGKPDGQSDAAKTSTSFVVQVTGALAADNVPIRRYKTIVERKNSTFGLLLVTPEEPAPGNPESHVFTEAEVRQLFESYMFPPKPSAP